MTSGLAFTAYDRAGWELMRELADDGPEMPSWSEVAGHITAMRDEPTVDLITFDAVTDRPGFGQPADPAAKDKRPGFRRFGQDAAPASTSFDRRFSFTQRATSPERSRTMPGVKMTAT